MDEKMKKFAGIINDENLSKELLAIKKPEDAQKWLKEHGVDLSIDELKAFAEKAKASAEGELTDDELELAAGGEYVTWEAEAVAYIVDWICSWFD